MPDAGEPPSLERDSPRAGLSLELLPDPLSICRLPPDAPLPVWATEPGPFVSVSRTADELSIVTLDRAVPPGVRCERGYRAFRVRGRLPFELVGILSAIAVPLAQARVSIFAVSTYDTDYVLVNAGDLDVARAALRRAGHDVSDG